MEFITNIIMVLFVVALFAVVAYIVDLARTKKPILDRMSFKESIDLTDLPILTFTVGDRKLNFILDTGASQSILHDGSLEGLSYKTVEGGGTVYGMEGNRVETSVIQLGFKYKDAVYDEVFQVLDISAPIANMKTSHGVIIHGFLGSSFFQKYRYIIDFNDLVAYPSR